MNHEAWAVASRGIFDQYLADLNAITHKDTRAVFINRGYGRGRLVFRAWQVLDYVISEEACAFLEICVEDPIYKPRYREDLPPIPQNVAQVDGVITCDAPPAGYTAVVYEYADDLFEEVGPLDETAHPAGQYVVVAQEDASGRLGLPSAPVVI